MNMEKIYEIVTKRNQKINNLYINLGEYKELFDELLDKINLPSNKETIHSITQRFVNLREDGLLNIMKKEGFSNTQIIHAQKIVYEYVKSFWLEQHFELIQLLKPYLGEFYYTLFKGIHEIGIVFSDWQINWTNTIIHGINKDLLENFGFDESKIFEMLRMNNLLDKGHDGEADRCYSVLIKTEHGYEVQTYQEAFEKDVSLVVEKLNNLISKLSSLKAPFDAEWINYFTKLIQAFVCKNRDDLVKKWSEVDIAWMDIKSPIQVGHPLEYYEDHFRKAVALELDIRVTNPNLKSDVKQNIVSMYKKFNKDKITLDFALQKIKNTQLYLGQPATFYGSEFNGLFSAQVVPNDEVASKLKGKKIFAFADKVLEDAKAKPKMKINHIVFGESFMKEQYDLLEQPTLWHKIYDITTIGHEFGHILWLDSDTESKMNASGAFKNVEEFKATTGGLMAFFENEEEELKHTITNDIIKRSVGLIAWMELPEVLPYYIEGLLHLHGLFESNILNFEKNLQIDYTEQNYQKLKDWYKENYLSLAMDYYLPKADPKRFLDKFIYKKNNTYKPKNSKISNFADYYYDLYRKIGQVVL